MRRLLLIGLGNPLMGDDGIGWHVAQTLAADARLPECVEVMCGGTDLLRCAAQMDGRDRVVVIDAIQDQAPPGTVQVFDDRLAGLESCRQHAHHLSVLDSVKLLKLMVPASFTLVAVSISGAAVQCQLSPLLEAHLPAIANRVLEEIS